MITVSKKKTYSPDLVIIFFQGQQAHIVLPPLYPDELSTFISKEEAKTFFKKLNKILQV